MKKLNGVDIVWETFSKLDSEEVCKRADVSFDDDLKIYQVTSFGQNIYISRDQQNVYSDSPEGKYLIGIKDLFFDLSLLWYLISVKKAPLSGNLIKPSTVPGGQIFLKGTHVLPLDKIAQKFNHNKHIFFDVSTKYGGTETMHGDVAVKLLPFPKLPIYLILWFGDEDFPPEGQLLVDSSCTSHLSTDVLWAVTMVCCMLFLQK